MGEKFCSQQVNNSQAYNDDLLGMSKQLTEIANC